MSREVWICDDPPADDPEEFEDRIVAAHQHLGIADVAYMYRSRRWATPISGDATTIRRKFTQ